VRGPQIMQGYFRDPEATDRTLTERLAADRDLGYKDEEDYVFIVDRLKELIKCKGFQVAPAEIRAHPHRPSRKSRTPPSSGRPIPISARFACGLRGPAAGSDCSAEALIEYAAKGLAKYKRLGPGGGSPIRYRTALPGRFYARLVEERSWRSADNAFGAKKMVLHLLSGRILHLVALENSGYREPAGPAKGFSIWLFGL